MKVLAISASPRKGGNSDVLCDQFLKGAAETGHEAEKIRLAEKRLTPCTACYGCMKTGICVKKDALPEIREKLLGADVIVLATPVYFYSMAAQMKLLIDRCLGFYQKLAGKRFYFIVTAAEPMHEAADETIAGLRGFLRCVPNAQECGILYGTGAWDKDDIYRHPAYELAYQNGKRLNVDG